METDRIRICKYGAPASADKAGTGPNVDMHSGENHANYKEGTKHDLYSGLIRWLSNDFDWNKRSRYFWLNLDTVEEINKNTTWQSGPNDAGTSDKCTNFNGYQFEPKTAWGDKLQSGKASRAEWKQSKQNIKMQLMMGDGEDGNSRNQSEGVQTGVIGMHCGLHADSDNSGSYANAGYDHVYMLYRIDATDELLEDILDQLGRMQVVVEAVKAGELPSRYANVKWEDKESTRRLLGLAVSYIRNGYISVESQPDSLFGKLGEGTLTSKDIFDWSQQFVVPATPRDTDISIIKRIIKWIISHGDAGQSRQEMMMLAEMKVKFPAETRSPKNYSWSNDKREFVCRRVTQQSMDMIFLLDLRANAILWHLDSDGSGGLIGYNRALRFTRCSPIYGYEPDNIYGKVFNSAGEELTAHKIPAPYKAFVHKGPGQKELYWDTREWPYEGTIPGLTPPPS